MIKTITQIRCIACAIVALMFVNTPSAKSQQIARPVAELIGSNSIFTEGPLWLDGVGLIFSDVRANTIYRLDSVTNVRSTFLTPSGNSNGLALDTGGNIVLAQHGTRAISRLVNGQLVPIVTRFRGDSLNSPNDLVVKSDGSIFFTDPPYGIGPGQRQYQRYYGIYRIGSRGVLYLLDSTFTRPNGLAFSPDENLLYVNETNTRTIYVFDVRNDSVLANKRVFFQFRTAEMRGADGMKIDPSGNVYSTAPTGVYIIRPTGQLLDTIAVPGSATNLAFGNSDRNTLYITAGANVYRARNAVITSTADNLMEQSGAAMAIIVNDVQAQTLELQINNTVGDVRLEVRNLSGQSLGTLLNGTLSPGGQRVTWNYNSVPGGIYIMHLTNAGKNFLLKTVLVK